MFKDFRLFPEFFRDPTRSSLMKGCPNRLKYIRELQFSKLVNGRDTP